MRVCAYSILVGILSIQLPTFRQDVSPFIATGGF